MLPYWLAPKKENLEAGQNPAHEAKPIVKGGRAWGAGANLWGGGVEAVKGIRTPKGVGNPHIISLHSIEIGPQS